MLARLKLFYTELGEDFDITLHYLKRTQILHNLTFRGVQELLPPRKHERRVRQQGHRVPTDGLGHPIPRNDHGLHLRNHQQTLRFVNRAAPLEVPGAPTLHQKPPERFLSPELGVQGPDPYPLGEQRAQFEAEN